MLVNFRFKNFRSFYDETNLSLTAVADKELKDINTFTLDVLPKSENELIKSAVIFGGNATGKSNVIKGLAFMQEMLKFSATQFLSAKHNEAFAFYDEAKNEISLYEVEIVQNGAYYKYGFTLKDGEVQEEWLDRREKRKVELFRRNKQRIEISGKDSSVANLINISAPTLFLSVGNNFHLTIGNYLNDVMSWFGKLFIVFENRANPLDLYTLEGGKYKDQALRILKLADIGINRIEVTKDKISFADLGNLATPPPPSSSPLIGQLKQENRDLFNIDLKTTFNVYNKANEAVSEKDIMLFKDFGFNSEGTVRLLCYLGFILYALDKGLTILIDEIDSKLHFLVVDYILKLFNSIDRNPNNAQLVCTAHNVMLMDEGLRRDQIYFTVKDQYSKSTLTSLSDYTNVRKSDLFSKKYLAGFYTKLPSME